MAYQHIEVGDYIADLVTRTYGVATEKIETFGYRIEYLLQPMNPSIPAYRVPLERVARIANVEEDMNGRQKEFTNIKGVRERMIETFNAEEAERKSVNAVPSVDDEDLPQPLQNMFEI